MTVCENRAKKTWRSDFSDPPDIKKSKMSSQNCFVFIRPLTRLLVIATTNLDKIDGAPACNSVDVIQDSLFSMLVCFCGASRSHVVSRVDFDSDGESGWHHLADSFNQLEQHPSGVFRCY